MIFWITYNDDAAAASLNLVALGHGFGGVICTLGVKIGSDFDNDCAYIVFRKDDDGVDVG